MKHPSLLLFIKFNMIEFQKKKKKLPKNLRKKRYVMLSCTYQIKASNPDNTKILM